VSQNSGSTKPNIESIQNLLAEKSDIYLDEPYSDNPGLIDMKIESKGHKMEVSLDPDRMLIFPYQCLPSLEIIHSTQTENDSTLKPILDTIRSLIPMDELSTEQKATLEKFFAGDHKED
jgi:hypothetical protein